MQDNIKIRIISSEKVVDVCNVQNIFLPLPNGTIEMLPGHCNYIGILSKGKVSYKTIDDEEKSFDINSGVCSLFDGGLEILID